MRRENESMQIEYKKRCEELEEKYKRLESMMNNQSPDANSSNVAATSPISNPTPPAPTTPVSVPIQKPENNQKNCVARLTFRSLLMTDRIEWKELHSSLFKEMVTKFQYSTVFLINFHYPIIRY